MEDWPGFGFVLLLVDGKPAPKKTEAWPAEHAIDIHCSSTECISGHFTSGYMMKFAWWLQDASSMCYPLVN